MGIYRLYAYIYICTVIGITCIYHIHIIFIYHVHIDGNNCWFSFHASVQDTPHAEIDRRRYLSK
jgi:hypothetical protein